MMAPSSAIMLLGGGLVLILFLVYHAMLPKPLPDIPYNRDAASKIFGDVPEVMRFVKKKKQIFAWFTSLTAKHNSPIVQAFIKPMSLPWVVVTDPYEIQDILLRRTKEFDRASFFKDVSSGVIKLQASQHQSDHPVFKHNRSLINHLMAPSFISQVSGPEVYKSICSLIELWKVKCDMSQGHPFSVNHEITLGALDGVFASLLQVTEQDSSTPRRLKAISSWTPPESATDNDIDIPVSFPDDPVAIPSIPPIHTAFLTLTNSLKHTQLSPFPTLTSLIHTKFFPSMRRAIATKESFLSDKINEAIALIDTDANTPARNAVHSVLLRERELAAKESRPPNYHYRGVYDEILGLVMAGHDTSATSVAWGAKYLTTHPRVQQRLRDGLKAAFPEAAKEWRAPSYDELAAAHIPYLEAVVEEVLRLSNSIDFVVRVALRDTTVLGRRIPKGTDVFLMGGGAGFVDRNILGASEKDDAMRSPGARKKGGKMLSGLWKDEDVGEFRPERWLREEEGKEVFDALAGPTLAFGLGPRGCYGKRLALVSLKMQFSMIVWHFELLETPPELSSFAAVQNFAREPEMCFLRLKHTGLVEDA